MVGDLFDQLMQPGAEAPASSSGSGGLIERDDPLMTTTGPDLVRREGSIVPVNAPTYSTTGVEPESSIAVEGRAPADGELSPLVLVALAAAAWWVLS